MAAEAGVSVQTVSNFINGRYEQMSSATRERVESVLVALGYHPDRSAQGLRSSRTRAVGFLVVDEHVGFLADPLTGLLMAGVGDEARTRHFSITVQGARPGSPPAELLAPILERRVDGALVVLSGEPELRHSYIEELRATEAPFVVFDELIEDPGVLSVRSNDRDGARQLAQHLIAQGHRRFGFIGARVPWTVVEQRFLGYRDALREAKIRPVRACERFEGSWEPDGGSTMLARLLKHKSPPTAVMCGSDLLAIAAVRTALDHGLRVPEDIAIVGFDDFPISAYLEPPLTTVAVPAYEMGRTATQMLIDDIEGEENQRPRHIVFDVALQLRRSG